MDEKLILWNHLKEARAEKGDFMDYKMFFRITIRCLFLCAVYLCGCEKHSDSLDFMNLEPDEVFLCTDNGDSEAGILLLDSRGKEILKLEEAALQVCMKPSGEIIPQTAGVLPSDTYLFISFYYDPLDTTNYTTGVWSIEKADWIFEPKEGMLAYYADEDVITSFQVGDKEYGLDFLPYKSIPETYEFENGLVLHNEMKDGNYYIASDDGVSYLTPSEFFERNSINADYLQDSISIEKVIMGKYMLLSYTIGTYEADGTCTLSRQIAFCNQNGNMLYPEWDYNYVLFVSDQFDHTVTDIMEFYDTDKDVAHYLDLTQMKELKIPNGYQQVLYRKDRTFLLQQGETYTVYDAGTGETGAVFMLDSQPQDIIVLSPDTYVVQEFNNSRIFIHDQEVSSESSAEYAPVCPSPYPVVLTGKVFGPYDASYIIDSEGNLAMKADHEILYADKFCYMYYEDEQFFIRPLE